MGYGPPPMGYGPPPAASRTSPAAIVAIFVGVMLGLALVAAIVVLLSQPAPPLPPCEPGQACAPQPSLPPVSQASPLPSAGPSAGPTTPPATLAPGATATPFVAPTPSPEGNSPPVVSGQVWSSATLGYSFEYDPELFTLSDSADDIAVFQGVFFDAQVILHAVPASTSPADLIAQELGVVDTFMISRVRDGDEYDALLGPSIGYVRGEGDVYSGTLLGSDGTPVAPGGVTVLAATDGRLTVAVVVIVGSPDERHGGETQQHAARGAADQFLKTFDWDSR
jgi:hypothetical protein